MDVEFGNGGPKRVVVGFVCEARSVSDVGDSVVLWLINVWLVLLEKLMMVKSEGLILR